jgi:replicative DNA helicase
VLIPPQNIDAEKALLGAMFHERKFVSRAINKLGGPETGSAFFFKTPHQELYKAMTTLYRDGKPAEIPEIKNYLGKEGMERIGGRQYLIELGKAFTGVLSESTIDIIIQKRRMRDRIAMTQEIRQLAFDHQEKGDEEVDFIKETDQLLRDNLFFNVAEEVSLTKVLKEVIEEWQTRMQHGGLLGQSSCIKALDKMTGGYCPQRLYVLAGRPGMGKTSLALQEGDEQVKAGKRVGIVTLEMGANELVSRLLCQRVHCDYSLLQTDPQKFANTVSWDELTQTVAEIKDSGWCIIDRPGADIYQICAAIENAHYQNPLSMAIIDYLQIIGGIDPRYIVQETALCTRLLKELARRLNIPILLLSQLSREVEKRKDKRPISADLRDSGGIEQDADCVIFIYREVIYKKDMKAEARGVTELLCRKNRQGPVGTVYCMFSGPDTWFYEDPYRLAQLAISEKYKSNLKDWLMYMGYIGRKSEHDNWEIKVELTKFSKPLLKQDPLPGDAFDTNNPNPNDTEDDISKLDDDDPFDPESTTYADIEKIIVNKKKETK